MDSSVTRECLHDKQRHSLVPTKASIERFRILATNARTLYPDCVRFLAQPLMFPLNDALQLCQEVETETTAYQLRWLETDSKERFVPLLPHSKQVLEKIIARSWWKEIDSDRFVAIFERLLAVLEQAMTPWTGIDADIPKCLQIASFVCQTIINIMVESGP